MHQLCEEVGYRPMNGLACIFGPLRPTLDTAPSISGVLSLTTCDKLAVTIPLHQLCLLPTSLRHMSFPMPLSANSSVDILLNRPKSKMAAKFEAKIDLLPNVPKIHDTYHPKWPPHL